MFRQMIFSLIALGNICAFGQSGAHFTDLQGMEDSLGNTHLFYRMSITQYYQPPHYYKENNNIYHLNMATSSDSIFLVSYFEYPLPNFGEPNGWIVEDFGFFSDDPSDFIATGSRYELDASPYVWLPDSQFDPWGCCGSFGDLGISRQNRNLLYGNSGGGMIKSSDGGYNWVNLDTTFSASVSFMGLSSLDDRILFFTKYENGSTTLKKSIDGGATYHDVNTAGWPYISNMLFDADSLHIYGLNKAYQNPHRLLVSNDAGENWFVSIADSIICVAIDPQTTGLVFISRNNSIFQSADYGQSLSLYWELPDTVIGMYKKPASDLLYAATKYKIYEITPTDTTVIKMLDPVGIGEPPVSVAEGFVLHQNYPNPFNPATTIVFELPRAAKIELSIFDISGRKVATVGSGTYTAGQHSLKFDAANLASGVYFYRLSTENGVRLTRKMLVLK